MTLEEELKQKALELGYAKAGITPAENFDEYYEEMQKREFYSFLWNDKRKIIQNAHLREHFPEAKSILSVVFNYSDIKYPENMTKHMGRAYLARCYGPPKDSVNGSRFELLKKIVRSKGIHIFEDAILPERAVAARAGTATYGKNNFAYADGCGSFIILSSIVMDKELKCDTPTNIQKCPKNCHKCIDACPTKAIYEPGKLEPQKCIGFNNWFRQTEKGVDPFIPEEIRDALGVRIHGCDICQEVCPRNKAVLEQSSKRDPFLEQLAQKFSLEKILFMTDDYYHEVIEPIMYNYIKDYRYFRRNAAIAMGNSGETNYIPLLKRAADDADPLIRDAALWGLKRLENPLENNMVKKGY